MASFDTACLRLILLTGSWHSVDGAKSLKEIRMSTASQFTILVITDFLATVCGLKP